MSVILLQSSFLFLSALILSHLYNLFCCALFVGNVQSTGFIIYSGSDDISAAIKVAINSAVPSAVSTVTMVYKSFYQFYASNSYSFLSYFSSLSSSMAVSLLVIICSSSFLSCNLFLVFFRFIIITEYAKDYFTYYHFLLYFQFCHLDYSRILD